ncbi:MAG: SET domain-containing protein [Bauldia sp.]
MLRVRTKIAQSPVHGMGLYADEFIPKGTLIWNYDPYFDVAFTDYHMKDLSEHAVRLLQRYAYPDEAIGTYILCADDARFINHSIDPNTDEVLGVGTVARRDIQPGEEILSNYVELGIKDFSMFAEEDRPEQYRTAK